jgi:apolipoprotein D and lipocalin family protein
MRRSWIQIAVIFLVTMHPIAGMAAAGSLATVEHVDLDRYQGTWYEVARLPLRWEKQCDANVTATYTLRADGKLEVVNRCRKGDGSASVSKGTAFPATKGGPASKLKVIFFWPFAGDYWILDLDPEYRWAIVGTPDRQCLWLLSRTPTLEEPLRSRLLEVARLKGFDTSRIILTKQER